MVGWLAGYTLASIVTAVIVVKIFDYVFAGMTGSVASSARVGLFVGTWTAVTAKTGIHGFSQKVRQLRQSNKKAIKFLIESEKP